MLMLINLNFSTIQRSFFTVLEVDDIAVKTVADAAPKHNSTTTFSVECELSITPEIRRGLTCEAEVNVDDDRYSRYILTHIKPLQIEYELIC